MSDFHQDVGACPDHPACTLITCHADADVLDHETGAVIHPAGTMVWASHADAKIGAEARINPDVPAYQDGKRLTARAPTAAEAGPAGRHPQTAGA